MCAAITAGDEAVYTFPAIHLYSCMETQAQPFSYISSVTLVIEPMGLWRLDNPSKNNDNQLLTGYSLYCCIWHSGVSNCSRFSSIMARKSRVSLAKL